MRAALCLFLAVWLAVSLAGQARAVLPDEVLEDPALEERARQVSRNLRCLVCQNQSIDDSDADLARDLRVLVRERIEAGDTNRQVTDYIVSRYGEFVLLRPRFSLRNALLWAAPIILLLAGGMAAAATLRNRGGQENALSREERKELDRILEDRARNGG